jgi:hypothetical protein
MLQKIKQHQRFEVNGITYIIYDERGKLAMTNIMGSERIITRFKYPKQLRLFHLWLLGIFSPKKQYVPYADKTSYYADKKN